MQFIEKQILESFWFFFDIPHYLLYNNSVNNYLNQNSLDKWKRIQKEAQMFTMAFWTSYSLIEIKLRKTAKLEIEISFDSTHRKIVKI